MSSVSSWACKSRATIWRKTGVDGMTKAVTYAMPEHFDCGYGSKNETRTDANGKEFVSILTLWTEYANAKQGDRVLLGEDYSLIPPISDSKEVKLVLRSEDVFDHVTDDYEIVT